ncbi:MAG: TPM domain-containing protein [Clostridia bacterium]|nr:TPM domain-containing protein [Clostridia bacterium]
MWSRQLYFIRFRQICLYFFSYLSGLTPTLIIEPFFNKTASHKIDISLRDAVFVCVIKISETYNYDVTIVTIDTIEDEDPDYAAELLFDSRGYGVEKNGGILLLVAMESRDVVVFYDGIVD